MGLFRKKATTPDPITDRSRELNAKIAALESKIKKLNEEVDTGKGPRFRSTSYPGGESDSPPPRPVSPQSSEPIFEKVDQNPLKAPTPSLSPEERFEELGTKKNDFKGLWERLKKEFQSPPAANPKLVNYLAAGSIQGLRPLRYEKRVMRNRCIALAILLVLVCLGILYVVEHRR
jgi:hypothetical protein